MSAEPRALRFIWDLDKTYLRTRFATARELLDRAFESAERKRNVPGTRALIQALRRGPGDIPRSVSFVSASPSFMRGVLEKKLRLDGVEFEDLALKSTWLDLMLGRFGQLREQVGYKLSALLSRRARIYLGADEMLFGDDAESDALIYNLYADILAGRIGDDDLDLVLHHAGVIPAKARRVLELSRKVFRANAVRRIYINLEERKRPGVFEPLGPRTVATFNSFQVALSLVDEGVIELSAVVAVAAEMASEHEYRPGRLLNSMADLGRRGFVSAPSAKAALEALLGAGIVPPGPDVERMRATIAGFSPTPVPVDPDFPIDYIDFINRMRAR